MRVCVCGGLEQGRMQKRDGKGESECLWGEAGLCQMLDLLWGRSITVPGDHAGLWPGEGCSVWASISETTGCTGGPPA